MPDRDALNLLSLAIEALQADDLPRARLGCEEAIRQDSQYAEAFSVYGVVLAEQQDKEAALAAFHQAVLLAPTTARYSYNLAAHQYVLQDFRASFQSVNEALKDDPTFAPAVQLNNWIESQIYGEKIDFVLPKVTRVFGEQSTQRVHGLSFMSGMERPWRIAGWCFVVLSLLAGICFYVFQPFPEPSTTGGKLDFGVTNTAGAMVTVFLLAVSGVLSSVWMLIDIVDRKVRLIWMIPSVACCSCGLHAVPQALYMWMQKDLDGF